MSSNGKLFLAEVFVEFTKNLKVRVWKGVLFGKIVYDAIGDYEGGLRVVPPRKLGGEVKAGEKVGFKVSFWGHGAEEALYNLINNLASLDYLVPLQVNVREVEVNKLPKGGEKPIALFFEVDHGPTYYKFHGAWVPMPSAQRMILSLFKRIEEVIGEKPDLKDLGFELSKHLEVVGGHVKFGRYKLKGGIEVPAFQGNVRYYGVMEEDLALKLLWALSYAPYLGLGGSPGLGMGAVWRVLIRKPPFETPVEAYSISKEFKP